MCAIAGMIDIPCTESTRKQMIDTMRRRGPDATGVYQDAGCTLLHSRLTVIDPKGGQQPMHLQWNGETYVITYNGEIYNARELRSELRSKGHTFSGHSDTEVVLHAYAQWKEDALTKLNGIFAFGIWEESSQKLFIARDRIGVKPLFYKPHSDGFIFASELKTILAYPSVDAKLDHVGAIQILLLGPGRCPGSGVFHGIYELEPGCCGYYCNGSFAWKRYWSLVDREHTDTFEETADKVRWLVCDAIRRQMVSDVPIGTFLSGGLDSSLITAVCAAEKDRAGESLHTFSVDYEKNDRYFVANRFQPNSDGAYIEKMVSQFGVLSHKTILSTEQLTDGLHAATCARDLPGMADVDVSMLLFCEQIRSKVKVALSGECADEIFGGYPWYTDPQVRETKGFPWAQNTAFRINCLHPDIAAKADAEAYAQTAYEDTVRSADVLPGTDPVDRRMKEMTCLNFRWFMQTLLDRKDRMSMYNGLEVRVPFCDYRIAEYLYCVPWTMKHYRGVEKGLLRYSMRGIIPDEVLWRKKSPYPKTFDPMYGQIITNSFCRIKDDTSQPIHQIIAPGCLQRILDADYNWPWYGQLMRGPQTMAFMLQINDWMKTYNVQFI